MNISKTFKTVGLVSIMSLSGNFVYAAGDHKHGPDGSHAHKAVNITKKEAEAAAKDIAGLLVKKGKLKKGWLQAGVKTADKKKFKNETEWVVTLENAKAEKSKQTLYVFLSLTGEYLGANFSGK